MTSPVEVTTKYVTTVDDLPAAWAFIMTHLEDVGADPTIEIRPIWIHNIGDMIQGLDGEETPAWPREFEVVVSGMTKQDTP